MTLYILDIMIFRSLIFLIFMRLRLRLRIRLREFLGIISVGVIHSFLVNSIVVELNELSSEIFEFVFYNTLKSSYSKTKMFQNFPIKPAIVNFLTFADFGLVINL